MKYAYGNYSSCYDSIDSKYFSKFSLASGNKWIKPTERNSPPLNPPAKAKTNLFSLNALTLNGIDPKIITMKNIRIITGILMQIKHPSYSYSDIYLNIFFIFIFF